MDFEAIRAKFDLHTEVEQDLGAPVKHHGKWFFWLCPFHTEKTPSFAVADDHYYCYGCGVYGDVTDWLHKFRGLSLEDIGEQSGIDDTETRLRRLEYQQRQQQRQIEEQAQRLSALESMHACHDYLHYHRSMPAEAWSYWYEAGLWPDTIERYQLGYCPRCPTDSEGRASYTIPVISNGKLWNIRHRLVNASNGDKYRPHRAGLPNVLFNADDLRSEAHDIIILEGEKKSMVASQEGLINVAVMGKSGFDAAWTHHFIKFRTVYVCYDPDARAQAVKTAGLFSGRGRVVELPEKLDDLLTLYGATAADIRAFLAVARPV